MHNNSQVPVAFYGIELSTKENLKCGDKGKVKPNGASFQIISNNECYYVCIESGYFLVEEYKEHSNKNYFYITLKTKNRVSKLGNKKVSNKPSYHIRKDKIKVNKRTGETKVISSKIITVKHCNNCKHISKGSTGICHICGKRNIPNKYKKFFKGKFLLIKRVL